MNNCREMTMKEMIEENNKLREELACLRVKCEALESQNKITDFKEAMLPAVEWFCNNCNPHQRIIIEADGVELVSGEMGFPVKVVD